MHEKLKQYIKLMRLDKAIGIFLLLWPTLWALWLARAGQPDIVIVALFVLGVILMRSAGCIINDYADKEIDLHVKRTQNRPLATGVISSLEALILFSILLTGSFVIVLFMNLLTIKLAVIGAMLAIVYPYLKRITNLPQVGLGVAFAWGVPMAFSAETNAVPVVSWVLFFAVMLWIIMYDTLYAMADRDDDIKIGVKSTAILFGKNDKWIIGILQGCFLGGLIVVGRLFHLDIFYYSSLLVVAGLFIYQQRLIKDRDPENCFQAFLNNHLVGLMIFIGIIL